MTRKSTIMIAAAVLLAGTMIHSSSAAGAYAGAAGGQDIAASSMNRDSRADAAFRANAACYADNTGAADTAYDEMFTDLDEAVFTSWKTEAIVENSNYFRQARIDVVDENGYDHQGMVYVCEGDESFTKGYRDYLAQLQELFADEAGGIIGYRNAAVRGYRTYRDHAIPFFCLQEVSFTDCDGIVRNGMLVVVDGVEEQTEKEWKIFSAFNDFYGKDK